MKTSKEFFEKLDNDESFAREIGAKVKAAIDAGETDYKALWIPIAAEYGYELTGEELDARYESAAAELSDEELGKVAGGTTPLLVITIGGTIGASLGGVISYVTYKTLKD